MKLKKFLSFLSSFVATLFESHQHQPVRAFAAKSAAPPLSPQTEMPAAKPPKPVVFHNKPRINSGFNWGPLVAIPKKSNGRLKTVLFESRSHKFLSAKVVRVEGPDVVVTRHGSRPFRRRLLPA